MTCQHRKCDRAAVHPDARWCHEHRPRWFRAYRRSPHERGLEPGGASHRIVSALLDGEGKVQDIAARLDAEPTVVSTRLAELVRRGYVRRTGWGRYVVTDQGREVAA